METECCAVTVSAAIRALLVTVSHLERHMQASQHHQQCLPLVQRPGMSAIRCLSDILKEEAARALKAAGRAKRDGRKVTGLVKAVKSSFRWKEPKGSTASAEPMHLETAAQEVQKDSHGSPEGCTEDRLEKQAAVRQGLAKLQSMKEGEQCLLKALLQLEGMRMLENCLTACLSWSNITSEDTSHRFKGAVQS